MIGAALVTLTGVAASMGDVEAEGRVQSPAAPAVIEVASGDIKTNTALDKWITEIRDRSDALVFLSGGASRMSEDSKRQLLSLLGALTTLSDGGLRIAVGDGGTQAGIMEAAGLARRAGRRPFPLLGVAPAPEILIGSTAGRTPIDPNHTHVIAVSNPAWVKERTAAGWTPDDGYWGSETDAMYEVFAWLARGKPSVTVVANGGSITLDEVRANVAAGRRMVVIGGSGRAADALVSALTGSEPPDDDVRALKSRVDAAGLVKRPELFRVFDLRDGPEALARVLKALLVDG